MEPLRRGYAPAAPAIPRRIWSYWHTLDMDPFVARCIASWRARCPEFEVLMLNQQTVRNHVPAADWPVGLEQLDPVKQSDWIRLYLVSRFGALLA